MRDKAFEELKEH